MAIDLNQIIKSYKDLLIIQYADKEKANATIEALTKEMLADGVFWEVLDGYNLETAAGEQLDVIGAWVGIDRFFNGVIFANIDFAFGDAEESTSGIYGFGDTSDASIEGGNLLNYDEVVSASQKLDDEAFRLLIKLKIVRNTSNHSPKQITDNLLKYFGSDIYFTDGQNMSITYWVASPDILQTVLVARDKGALIKPVGVRINIINNPQGELFAMGDSKNTSVSGYGFGDTSDDSVIGGDLLSYQDIY